MKNLVLASLLLPLLSGCFLYDCGYTRNDDTAVYKTDASNKMPISYSLDFETMIPRDEPGIPTFKSLNPKIEEALRNTGLFSEVSYCDGPSPGYHIKFQYRDDGTRDEERFALCYFCGTTLMVVPVVIQWESDLSAILYLNDKPIYSTAHAEKCRYIYWIGALPAGLVLNYWSVWRSIEYNIVRSTVNDLAREHIRRYLDPASVELTNPEEAGASNARP